MTNRLSSSNAKKPAKSRWLLRLMFSMIVASLAVTGCARRYTMVLSNGGRITSRGKPALVEGAYVYTDMNGQPASVPAGRVREVAPASMASPSIKSGYRAEPVK